MAWGTMFCFGNWTKLIGPLEIGRDMFIGSICNDFSWLGKSGKRCCDIEFFPNLKQYFNRHNTRQKRKVSKLSWRWMEFVESAVGAQERLLQNQCCSAKHDTKFEEDYGSFTLWIPTGSLNIFHSVFPTRNHQLGSNNETFHFLWFPPQNPSFFRISPSGF